MRIKQSNRFGTLSPQELRDFERDHALRLPEDYRQFLLQHNGGDPHPTNVIDLTVGEKPTLSDVQFFYGIHDSEPWARIEWHLGIYQGRIVEEGLPIAGDSGGNQYVLILRGEREGQVYFWDHEQETLPPSYANMSYVALSFAEFAAKLYQHIEPDEAELERILRQNDLLALQRLLESEYSVEQTDEYNRTLIENAAIQNRPEIIQLLFGHGAQLRRALHYARQNYEFFPEHKEAFDLLERLQRERGS